AVADHRDEVPLGGVLIGQQGVSLDLFAGICDAGAVGQGEVPLRRGRLGGEDLNLPLAAARVVFEGVLAVDLFHEGLMVSAPGGERPHVRSVSMIVVAEQETWLFITQPDHAAFAAELTSLWRAEGVPDHPRRADLLFAVREHDNGWREADAAPRWNRERRLPHDFLTIPRPARIEVWERGVSRFAGERPWAALLITRHARRLHRDRRGVDGWEDLLETLDELERGLAEATGATEEEIARD